MQSKQHSPYLSIVVTSRNDSDEAMRRLQVFVDTLTVQVECYGLSCELVIVEWNYPLDRPSLGSTVKWPIRVNGFSTRIIRVPAEIHTLFRNSDTITLFQMMAKNVGIRRARGRFILATNIDILFSNELIRYFASESLDENRMYRIDRYDIPSEIPEHLSVDELLVWCHHHILRLYRYLETVDVVDGMAPRSNVTEPALLKRTIDWVLRREKPLHTNACGDFTLLSARYWETVKGYPEFPLRAMKLDGLLCYAAHYAGARQAVFENPMRIYHLDHPARDDGALIALTSRGVDAPSLQLSPDQYRAWIRKMQHVRRPIIFNKEGWGLSNEVLNEIVAY